jgi:myo-inositol-1(or 4)-monophosphatase
VDKKSLLNQKLRLSLGKYVDQIDQQVLCHAVPQVKYKPDGSPVTPLDLLLSDFFAQIAAQEFPAYTFYSEESFSSWRFPLLALDPIDGTREYIAGRAEWAISVGLVEAEDFTGEGWIYNPITRQLFAEPMLKPFVAKSHYVGEISRSEWEKGEIPPLDDEKFKLNPMGSIAYKLARLSHGETDYVLSCRPKNIWDIAAGTILCRQAGLKFYAQGREVTEVKQLFQPPLIWCHPQLFPELCSLFR